MALDTAGQLKELTSRLGIPFIYKSSFDKANRSSLESFRGLGLDEGLRILQKVKNELGVPVITDVHEDTPIDEVADVVDVLQTPAFLCRQTNFILRVAAAGKPVNIRNKIGRVPVLAVGNSRGDLEMLNYSKTADHSLQMVVNHDDAEREYEYSVEKMKKLCAENGWIDISMKNDFITVFGE